MKKYLLIIGCLLSVLLISCAKTSKPATDTDYSLIGKWIMTESLADPGDGSGTWSATDKPNYYYLEFKADKTIKSNLFMGMDGVEKYEIVNDSVLNFIYPDGNKRINIYRIENTSLTLTGGCIEQCGFKFIRSKK